MDIDDDIIDIWVYGWMLQRFYATVDLCVSHSGLEILTHSLETLQIYAVM